MNQTRREDCLRQNIKRQRIKLTGCCNLNVPYEGLIVVLIVLTVSITAQLNAEELAKQVQVPTRPLPAETILLKDGSTTFVSSLEDFLSMTVLPELETITIETTTTTATKNSSPGEITEQDNATSKFHLDSSSETKANPSELEREETTPTQMPTSTSTSTTTTSTSTGKPDQQAAKSGLQLQQEPRQNYQGGGQHEHEHHPHEHHHVAAANSSQKGKILQHYEVRGLLNVTNDYPLAYSQIICGYVWPLMAAITMFTNLMIVFVLTQNDMRTPTNVVLTAIAIADIIPIIVPVPWFVYLFAMGNEKQVLYPPTACYFYQHSTRSVSEIFYFLSTWLNVLLAVQDYLTACWPQLAKKYCQIKVVVIEVISLTILAFLLNLPQAIKLVFKPVKFIYNGQLTYGCKALQARWFKELIGEYAALYDDIFTAIIVVFVDGGPAIALVTLTWLLIRQLQRQRIQGHLLMEQARTASKRRRERHRQQEYEASARVMIFVLLAFLAVKMPFATTYTLMIIQSRFEVHFMESLNDFQKALTLIDLVFVLSYPLNFTIFCCCSKKFRHKCAELLGKCNSRTKSAKSRLIRSISGSFNSETLSIAHGNYKRDSMATEASQAEHHLQQARTSLALTIQSGHSDDLDRLQYNNSNNNNISNNNNNNNNHHQHHMDYPPTSATVASKNYKLDQVCDGRNHFDLANYRPPKGIGQSDLESAEFKALLDDGSLCFECIMRYEQLRAQWLQPGGPGKQASPQRQLLQLRRASDGSTTSWPTCLLPPPPPPIHNAHLYQQLPQIVTTRCDSIRERPSSEEAELGLVGDCVVAGSSGGFEPAAANSASQREHSDEKATPSSSSNHLKQVAGKEWLNLVESRKPSGSELGSLSMASWRSSDDGSMQNLDLIWRPTTASRKSYSNASADETQSMANQEWRGPSTGERSFQNELCNLDNRNDQLESDGGHLGRPGESRGRSLGDTRDWPATGAISTDRRSSDRPATKLEQMRFHHNRQESIRRSVSRDGSKTRLCSSQGDNKIHAPRLQDQLEKRQRSLSMSNSKLSALASATGLLAGIIKTTLLTADNTHQNSHSDSLGNNNSGCNNNTNYNGNDDDRSSQTDQHNQSSSAGHLTSPARTRKQFHR